MWKQTQRDASNDFQEFHFLISFEKAEIIARASGQEFFASESSEIFEKSLTAAIDKIIPQIKKHHDKRLGKVKTHQVSESEDSD